MKRGRPKLRSARRISRRPKAGQQGRFGGAEPLRHPHPLQPKISAKRSRLSAGQRPASRGGCRGGSAPPPNIILLLLLSLSSSVIMIIIIIKIKRPNGEAPEISRRPKACQQGDSRGQRAPDTIIHYNRKTLAKRSSGARGGCGVADAPPPNDD